MVAFSKIKEGMILWESRKEYRMGRRYANWPVYVKSVDVESRSALCSWNGNKPQTYTEGMLKKLGLQRKE